MHSPLAIWVLLSTFWYVWVHLSSSECILVHLTSDLLWEHSQSMSKLIISGIRRQRFVEIYRSFLRKLMRKMGNMRMNRWNEHQLCIICSLTDQFLRNRAWGGLGVNQSAR